MYTIGIEYTSGYKTTYTDSNENPSVESILADADHAIPGQVVRKITITINKTVTLGPIGTNH